LAVEIIAAEQAHITPIAERMREADRVEARAFGHSPEMALQLGLWSGPAHVALVDGLPEAMFGLRIKSALAGIGTPWMLGTEAVYRHGREMLRMGAAVLRGMFDSTPSLENLVSADNARAIRLLERWGFVVEREVEMIGGVPFRMFWQERP
jgi:hypothetical protein